MVADRGTPAWLRLCVESVLAGGLLVDGDDREGETGQVDAVLVIGEVVESGGGAHRSLSPDRGVGVVEFDEGHVLVLFVATVGDDVGAGGTEFREFEFELVGVTVDDDQRQGVVVGDGDAMEGGCLVAAKGVGEGGVVFEVEEVNFIGVGTEVTEMGKELAGGRES